MPVTFILTCEHAGNLIPPAYEYLFKEKEEILYSHKAIDFGALRLAKHLAAATHIPLYYTSTSRLLVEANRSPDSEELFSGFTKSLPVKEKEVLLATYYHPHREQVTKTIEKEIAAGNQVYHVAIHTFTPVLEGEVRTVETGILFDPDRALEVTFARQFKKELLAQNPNHQVQYNAPYPGIADGFPTHLRTKFKPNQYAGFELEINQKFFLQGEPEVWQTMVTHITQTLENVMNTLAGS